MTTPHRIAAVSLALQRIVAQAIPMGVEVTTLPLARAELFVPSANPTARVNVALIRAAVPTSIREAHPRPSLVSEPAIPLEIQYVVTFHGDAPPAVEHSVERLLEAIMQQLHQHPVLTPADLEAALPGADTPLLSVSVHYESLSDTELRDLFVCCRATWQPALVYRVRLTHS
ncbi:MAG: DUF4255 domain-containing protein [Verrucomicrobiales bacterium]|nr:DUF4255 domain-containing protein [Verrucomicrobiales bacterium]